MYKDRVIPGPRCQLNVKGDVIVIDTPLLAPQSIEGMAWIRMRECCRKMGGTW